MRNHKEKRNKREQKRINQLAALGIEAIQEFFYHISPDEALDQLWNLFHYSMISDARGDMTTHERADAFFLYEQLKELINTTRKVV